MGKRGSDGRAYETPAERDAQEEPVVEARFQRRADLVHKDDAAVTRRSELRQAAASMGGELRSAAAAKGSELRSSAASRAAEVQQTIRDIDVPWARCRLARVARETILQVGLAPLMDLYLRLRVVGREWLREITPPVVLVANHSSHLDTPTILRALPLAWRQRTAVGAAADYFYDRRAVAGAVALAFNTVPIMRRGGGMGDGSLDHVDRLLDERWNLLMFPEGTRSRDGNLGPLRSGAAVIAREHGIPLVPIRVEGTFAAMPPGRNWPRRTDGSGSRHEVAVAFGPPIWPTADEDGTAVMARIRPHLRSREIESEISTE